MSKGQKQEIAQLCVEIEKAERAACEKLGGSAPFEWIPPSFEFITEFRTKYAHMKQKLKSPYGFVHYPSVKRSWTEYYHKEKTEAYAREISIMKTRLRIAQGARSQGEAYFEPPRSMFP